MGTPYSAEQMELLASLMPKVMRVLRKHAPHLYRKLDEGRCWHVPACLPGDECIGGEPSAAERAAMLDGSEEGGDEQC